MVGGDTENAGETGQRRAAIRNGSATNGERTGDHGPLLIEDGSAVSTTSIDVNGASVKLQQLGPVVINSDGTMSRINNWHEMTEAEQITTKRILAKRNANRREDILQGARTK